jgi:hypothetical protein
MSTITVAVRSYDDVWEAIDAARERHSYSVRSIYRKAGKWCADVMIFDSITRS